MPANQAAPVAAISAPAARAGAAPGGQRATAHQRPAGDQVGGGAVELARLPRDPLDHEAEREAGDDEQATAGARKA